MSASILDEKEPILERALQIPLPPQARVPGADHVGLVEHRDVVVSLIRSLAMAAVVAR